MKENDGKQGKKTLRKTGIAIAIICAVILVIGIAVVAIGKGFTAQEAKVRSDWSTEVGTILASDEDLKVSIHDASLSEELRVLQVVPSELEDEDFTYYNDNVQTRLSQAIEDLKASESWVASNPLAIINPFGTGSNGLYLYFNTEAETSVSYTVNAAGYGSEWAAKARNSFADESLSNDDKFTKAHEFQIVGLVPGAVNEVTLDITDRFGITRQTVTFTVTMPETQSGYATQLEYIDGEGTDPDSQLSNGLYASVRVNGYLGFAYFYDNDGVMRYEMVTEGYGLDRILEYGDCILACTSSRGLSMIDGAGRVVKTYRLDGYEFHHDICFGTEDTVIALVNKDDSDTVEDVVVQIDLASGEVTELVDFSNLMDEYADEYTRPINATDPFFWQVGVWDWLHLNTVQYLEEDDALIVSSRETSTIIKVNSVHTEPTLEWFAGDSAFWKDTPYEELCLEQVGDFKNQFGQHSVEYDGEAGKDGAYYLMVYDNNYWAISSRDNYEPDLSGTDAGVDLYEGDASYVYRYLIDENEGTYELVASFDVPYSSIVSNVTHAPESDNYVTNSGVANVFGEYTTDGQMIREFSYDCTLQAYRVFKDDFAGFWFK